MFPSHFFIIVLVRLLVAQLLVHAFMPISCTSYIVSSILSSINLDFSFTLLLFPSSTH